MGQLTFQASAGVLIRGQVRRALRSYAFERGYKLTIEEDKGMLESLLLVKLDLPDSKVEQAKRELQAWSRQLS